MSRIFSEYHRAELWRDLWIWLAEEEKRLGLPISDQQISELKKTRTQIDLARVRELETELKHDVMSHIKAYGEVAPKAEAIIHLGATSCYVTDNSDVLILKEAVNLILIKLAKLIDLLGDQIEKWKSLRVAGFTHFQPAQPVTMGKRFCLWAQDLLWDFQELEYQLSRLRPLGCKGATGTQASFMILFDEDLRKVRQLDEAICKRMGFEGPVAVSGQTLSRKVDIWFLQALASLASSFSKISYDFRLLQHLGEVKEPFGKKQVGSSAMAYKQNPILAERISSLSRFVMSLPQNALFTHGTQWLERSLDDSANRRIVVSEAFLGIDSICEIAMRLFSGLQVDPEQAKAFLEKHRDRFATEEIMMRGTIKGGSRQDLHEKIRQQMLSGKIKKGKEDGVYAGAAEAQATRFYTEQIKLFRKQQKSRIEARLAGASAAL